MIGRARPITFAIIRLFCRVSLFLHPLCRRPWTNRLYPCWSLWLSILLTPIGICLLATVLHTFFLASFDCTEKRRCRQCSENPSERCRNVEIFKVGGARSTKSNSSTGRVYELSHTLALRRNKAPAGGEFVEWRTSSASAGKLHKTSRPSSWGLQTSRGLVMW